MRTYAPRTRCRHSLILTLIALSSMLVASVGCAKDDKAPTVPAGNGGTYNQGPGQTRTPKEEAG